VPVRTGCRRLSCGEWETLALAYRSLFCWGKIGIMDNCFAAGSVCNHGDNGRGYGSSGEMDDM